MNPITRSLCFVLLGGALAIGCEEAPSSVGTSDPSFGAKPGSGGGGSTTPANPELCYVGRSAYKSKSYMTLFVMNADGSNLTPILRRTSTNYAFGGSPTWSPDGGSIAFTLVGDGVNQPDTIKAIDISVDNNGAVVGSNLRTIVGLSTVNVRIKNPFWSATTGTDVIAYVTDNGTTNSLYTVPAAGGASTLISTIDKAWAGHTNPLGTPTWNGDDSKLAMIRLGVNNTTIMIYNTSTWDYIDSITVAGGIAGLEWSRAGSTNSLAYSIAGKIYYVAPTTGAAPTTNNASGSYPAWAPDNNSMMVVNSSDLYKNTAFSASSSYVTALSYITGAVKWK
jgi:Tol biopolymer transport system component